MLLQNWNEEVDKFWPKQSKVSNSFTLMGPFWAKYITFQLKIYRGIVFDSIEDWYKTLRKNDLCFLKRHEEFWKFLQAEK